MIGVRARGSSDPGHGGQSVLMIEQGGRGGVADYTGQLTQALAADGWQVTLATAADHRYTPVAGVKIEAVFHYVRGHSRLARMTRRCRLGPPANALRFLRAIPRLVRLSRAADIVHSQGWEYAPLGLLAIGAMRLAGARVVQTTHNTLSGCGCTVWRRSDPGGAGASDRSDDRARQGGSPPRATCGGRAGRGHTAWRVRPLAEAGGVVDRVQARTALGIPADSPVTLLFGHLRPDKGLGDLLEAVIRLPRMRLLIGGMEAGALAAAAALLRDPRLAGRVAIREGFLEMEEAAMLFAATDTVALPYAVASQSGVLLLSYGFRRPVIVYPVGGLVEAVTDGETGWICRRPDVDSLVQALEQAADAGWPECRRRGKAGARFAASAFAWPEIARRRARRTARSWLRPRTNLLPEPSRV